MKTHLNTVYVTTQGTYLGVEGQAVVAKIDGEITARIPLHMLEGLVCFGRVSLSPYLVSRCAELDIGISHLTIHGRFLARVQGPVSGNVLLRREQFRRADDSRAAAEIARVIVMAKVANSRTVLQRTLRDHAGGARSAEIEQAVRTLATILRGLVVRDDLDTVRGLEGEAARTYFSVFDALITSQKESFRFERRTRRPPTDPVNALLSFVYTLLCHDAASVLEAVGLDPQVGFLHRDRPGRPGLALDLMEEFRSVIADRLVLALINRKQVRRDGFVEGVAGGFQMTEETRKVVLTGYQKRKAEEIRHPFLDEKTTVGMLVHLQARLMARHLRGDLDGYPPFMWR